MLSVVAGLAVFATFVWQIGPGEIWSGIRNVGWMFPVIIALGGLRFLVRAWAWTLCVDHPHHLPFRPALTAVLGGVANFGLLNRQRAPTLPFYFVLLYAARRR